MAVQVEAVRRTAVVHVIAIKRLSTLFSAAAGRGLDRGGVGVAHPRMLNPDRPPWQQPLPGFHAPAGTQRR
jgi:hypothetical protein